MEFGPSRLESSAASRPPQSALVLISATAPRIAMTIRPDKPAHRHAFTPTANPLFLSDAFASQTSLEVRAHAYRRLDGFARLRSDLHPDSPLCGCQEPAYPAASIA